MRLFIDESGDPGLHVERRGTSPHFVLAGVLIRDDGALDRCRMGLERFKRVVAHASHSEPMLQLADMVAGAVARSYKPEMPEYATFRGIIKGRELGVQFWPR